MKALIIFQKFYSFLFLFMIILSSSLIFQGCTFVRSVKDNRVYSSYPAVQIVVDKEFQYVGSDMYPTPAGDSFSQNVFFYFISKKNESQIIMKGILIETSDVILDSSRWVYIPRVSSNKAKNVVSTARLKRGFVTITGVDDESESAKWLKEKGYILPKCMFNYVIYGFGSFSSKYITYFEDAALSGLRCDISWESNKTLGELEKDMKEIVQRAEKAIMIEKF